MNEVAERMNCTFVDTVRTYLIDSKFSIEVWAKLCIVLCTLQIGVKSQNSSNPLSDVENQKTKYK